MLLGKSKNLVRRSEISLRVIVQACQGSKMADKVNDDPVDEEADHNCREN